MNEPTPADLHLTLPQARWRRSSHSGGANDCVELTELGAHVALRDSKRPELTPLVVRRAAFRSMIDAVRSGKH
ncbi:DUF397 domain-containing protein [Streptomyces sp. B6B3]|uniref:DUF397 domain-containing protein n=1 Tax=Streptomyces sp. B6B3 TaxID=3153570 RepID=UPI00325F98BB